MNDFWNKCGEERKATKQIVGLSACYMCEKSNGNVTYKSEWYILTISQHTVVHSVVTAAAAAVGN